ncbi:hypothetical protein M011DRAFT_210062 [Sporormia fimetaria CBS 119925]|uniref:Uncharacterized protein n=1 Tax=Sporormia fimetaria CBS 119925 TaxID=1340428 RepID=A0A6A6V3H7_9PLEO|nr:hypothetical protein M011DRAFT_210062 [Sporormia fimetaria CBS 119925]
MHTSSSPQPNSCPYCKREWFTTHTSRSLVVRRRSTSLYRSYPAEVEGRDGRSQQLGILPYLIASRSRRDSHPESRPRNQWDLYGDTAGSNAGRVETWQRVESQNPSSSRPSGEGSHLRRYLSQMAPLQRRQAHHERTAGNNESFRVRISPNPASPTSRRVRYSYQGPNTSNANRSWPMNQFENQSSHSDAPSHHDSVAIPGQNGFTPSREVWQHNDDLPVYGQGNRSEEWQPNQDRSNQENPTEQGSRHRTWSLRNVGEFLRRAYTLPDRIREQHFSHRDPT